MSGSAAILDVDHAGVGEVPIGARDGRASGLVAVGRRTDARQLVSRAQRSGLDIGGDLAADLKVPRHAAARLLRAAGGIARLIGVRSRPGEPAALDDQVLLADRPVAEPALEDLTGTRGI